MPVYRREYSSRRTKKPVWGYSFVHRKCRFRKAGYLTKSEAELAEQKARKDVIFDGRVLNPSSYRSFESVADEVIQYRDTTCARSTVKAERGHLVFLKRHFGKKRIDLIEPADIQMFIQKRKKDGLKNRTINIEVNLLRAIFGFAHQRHYVLSNPTIGIKRLKEVIKDRQCMSVSEFQRLMTVTEKPEHPNQLRTWIAVMAYTGMRPSEVLHLEWSDIYFDKERIVARPKEGSPMKTGTFRNIPLHPDLLPILEEWKAEWDNIQMESGHTHDWIFVYPADPSKRAQGFRKSFSRALKEAGIVPKSRYEFRHFFISQAVMQGIDLLTVARWVGHSSPQMIYRYYGHLSPDWQGKQMEKLKFGE